MKPESALRLLHWAVLAFVLIGLGPARAQDAHPLDLDQTRAALSSIESALRDKNLTDPDLQALKGQNDALGLALQGAIADLTPRLAASAKRLAELTPKSGETAPTTDLAAKELESEKKRHDTLDANLRAARAMLLESDDISTRISAARRQLFARHTFARSSSVLDPQLWAAVCRRAAVDCGENRHCGGCARARAGRRAARVAHAPGRLSRSRRGRPKPAPPRARRRVDLLHPGGAAARRPWPHGERARRLRPFRSKRPGPHRGGA
jgi:Protein of unknown function (DUF3772)